MASRATNANKEAGTQAEEYVARQIGGERTPNAWYDVEAGGIHEVKSTQERLRSGRRGRFRLWKDQHQNLRDHGGTYHFLVDGVGYVQLDAEEIDELMDEEGLTWAGSGDHPQDTQQLKVTWRHIMDEDGQPAR
jgi:hypothetical protein